MTLDLLRMTAQITATLRDPKLSRPLVTKLIEMFEPGKSEKVAKKSAQEDAELMELAKRSYQITLGASPTLIPGVK